MSDIVNNTYDLLGELTNLPLFLVDIPLSPDARLENSEDSRKKRTIQESSLREREAISNARFCPGTRKLRSPLNLLDALGRGDRRLCLALTSGYQESTNSNYELSLPTGSIIFLQPSYW